MSNRRSERGRAVHDGATRVLSAVMIVLGVLLALRGALLAVALGIAMDRIVDEAAPAISDLADRQAKARGLVAPVAARP